MQTSIQTTRLLSFGTVIDISIYTADTHSAQQAFDSLQQHFSQLHIHTRLHAWQGKGLLQQINQAIAAGKPINIPPVTRPFLQQIRQLAQQSDYLFNPAIGHLIALRGFHQENWTGTPPTDQEIQYWVNKQPKMQDIQVHG
mgnify:CR=1 FL=1|jgi:FAD:protein FMN transferase